MSRDTAPRANHCYPDDCHVRPCTIGWACRNRPAAPANGEVCAAHNDEAIIGESGSLAKAVSLMRKVANRGASTVLLLGESGTGKDLFARALHAHSARAAGPFVATNCAAIPDALLESELFGHEKGAFTDARAQKKGVFELACGGTLFLDEISELKSSLQAKLLRAIDTMTFRRVGGERDLTVNVRVVAASNRDLEAAAQAGTFREDLYYRLRVIEMTLPPLRQRRDDIVRLATYFIHEFARKFQTRPLEISPAAVERLQSHAWPGNVRELRNAIERAVVLEDGGVLTPSFLPIPDQRGAAAGGVGVVVLPPEGTSLEAVEESLVRQAMARAGGNQTRAAQLLGIGRDALRYKLKKFGLAATRDENDRPSGSPGAAPEEFSYGAAAEPCAHGVAAVNCVHCGALLTDQIQ